MPSLKPLASLIAAYPDSCTSLNYETNVRRLARRLLELNPSLSRTKEFYCYVYLDPTRPGDYRYTLPSGKSVRFSHEPFYVGKGKGGRSHAHLRSIRDFGSQALSHKASRIRKILKAGFEPIIKVTSERRSDSYALAYEIDLIAGIGRSSLRQGPLTNGTDGGEGGSGLRHTNKSKAKMSEALRGLVRDPEVVAKMIANQKGRPVPWELREKRFGRTYSDETVAKRKATRLARGGFGQSEETKAKISRARMGMKFSPETCARISEAKKGRVQSPDERARRSAALKLSYQTGRRKSRKGTHRAT